MAERLRVTHTEHEDVGLREAFIALEDGKTVIEAEFGAIALMRESVSGRIREGRSKPDTALRRITIAQLWQRFIAD